MVLVRDLMVINPNTIHPDTPLSQVLELMRDASCRHLPVLENGILVGIISERDVRLAVNIPALDMETVRSDEMRAMTTGEIMAPDPITARPDSTIQQAAQWLNANTIGALPVMDNGILVGIITVFDILDYVAGLPESVVA